MLRFTHFFRNFFVTEKQTPQTFSLLECMSSPVICKLLTSFSPSIIKLVQAREALETKREEEQGRLEVRIQMLKYQLVIKDLKSGGGETTVWRARLQGWCETRLQNPIIIRSSNCKLSSQMLVL